MQFTLITAEQVYRCWQWLTIINNNALINSSEMHRQQLKNLPTCWTFNSIVHLGARLQKTLDTISTNQIAPFLTPTVGIYQGSIPFQACRGTCHVIVGISWFASKFLLPAILQLTLLSEHTRPVMWGGGVGTVPTKLHCMYGGSGTQYWTLTPWLGSLTKKTNFSSSSLLWHHLLLVLNQGFSVSLVFIRGGSPLNYR